MTAMWGGSSRQKFFPPLILRSAIVSLFPTDPGELVSSLFQPRSVFQALTGCPSTAVPESRCKHRAKSEVGSLSSPSPRTIECFNLRKNRAGGMALEVLRHSHVFSRFADMATSEDLRGHATLNRLD
jgi:hypothetical protein